MVCVCETNHFCITKCHICNNTRVSSVHKNLYTLWVEKSKKNRLPFFFLLTSQLVLFLLAYWMWDGSPLGDFSVWFHINTFGIDNGVFCIIGGMNNI